MYHNFRKIEIPGALEKNVTAHNIFFLFAKKKVWLHRCSFFISANSLDAKQAISGRIKREIIGNLLIDYPDGKLKETEIFFFFLLSLILRECSCMLSNASVWEISDITQPLRSIFSDTSMPCPLYYLNT